MNPFKFFLVLFALFELTACNTTIYPEYGNSYSSTTTSSAQTSAERNARQDIENHCKKMGKRLVVLDHHTNYYGTTTGNKIAGALVGGIIGIPNPAVSADDYEVKTRFRCQ